MMEGQGKSSIAPTFSKQGYNYDGPKAPMLHTKPQGHWPFGSEEEDF